MSRRGANIVETQGKLTISRVNSTLEDDYIEIRIEDKPSATSVVWVKMSMENFAQAITGHASIKVDLDIFQSDNFGKKLETKHFPVIVEADSYVNEENFKKLKLAAKKFFINGGWKLNESSWNSRNYNYQTKQYQASFYRHVEVSE